MTAFLLDVNVLIAMSWPSHRSHDAALRWFGANHHRGWATCPIVEIGFVRIMSNPAFSPHAVRPQEAIRALSISLQRPTHKFWADDLSAAEVLQILGTQINGHQQVTDAYLVALAIHHGGKLATLDASVAQWAPVKQVEVIK